MSDLNHPWNPDDGPPPTEGELRDAARLAAALDGPVPAVTAPDTAALLATALRVKAIAHPDHEASRAAARRALRDALKQAPTARAWWASPRLQIAAAAVAILVAAGVGGRAYLRGASHEALPDVLHEAPVFDAPVEPGAGSQPATRLYDHELHAYRDTLLGGEP